MNLTQVKAKRRELKATLVDKVRDSVSAYSRAYVFSYENMRTAPCKDLRQAMSDSRFFLGKNRVVQKALGATPADEHRPGLSGLSAALRGNVGLLFTERTADDVAAAFEAAAAPDFARAGFVTPVAVAVPRGPIGLPHTMVDELRKLGMASLRLEKGVPVLPTPFAICAAKDVLTPEQCRLLKHFGHALATFRLRLVAGWCDGVVTQLGEGGAGGAIDEAEDEGGEDDESDDE